MGYTCFEFQLTEPFSGDEADQESTGCSDYDLPDVKIRSGKPKNMTKDNLKLGLDFSRLPYQQIIHLHICKHHTIGAQSSHYALRIPPTLQRLKSYAVLSCTLLLTKRLDSALFQSIGIFSAMLHAIHTQNISK